MNFFSLFSRKPPQKKGKIKDYSAVTTKTFDSYKTATGDVSVDYDLVENLYKRTIMRRIINKLAGDATKLGFKFKYYDETGKEHQKATEIGRKIDALLTRNLLRNIYRDMLLYGDAFLYILKDENEVYKIIGINPKYITPTEKNGELIGWEYQPPNETNTVQLTLEEVVHIPNDPLTGELFGQSIFSSVLQSLNLILNSQLNAAILLDRYAIPIVHWKIDSKNERKKTSTAEIKNFINTLKQTTVGSDLVTDSSIEHDVIGTDSSMIDFRPILDKLDHYFFATVGVPGQLLGFPADNLSAISKQLQVYYDTIHDIQSILADYLITQLYKPMIETAGITEPIEITPIFNKPTIENESRVITWVKDALALDLITREQAIQALGYQGKPPETSNELEWLLGKQSGGPNFDKNLQKK